MTSPFHILFLVPGFPEDENDFNCIPPLQEFLIKFKSEYPAINISVIAFQYPYQSKTYQWNEIRVFPLNGKNNVLKKILVWLKAISLSSKIHKENPINIIHSLWLGECALIGNRLSKKINIPHICTLMGQDVKTNNRYLKLSESERIRIIALSKNQSDEFFRLTGRRVDDIIHWGIDDQNVDNVERDIDLLAVGSLIPLKNYSLFIELASELKKIYLDLKCKLVGTGPELPKLKTLAKEKGVSENVEFTGLLSRHEIFKLMQKSKILVHPSNFEGSGFVFAEALVNGMNIVSFNVGYARPNSKWFIAKNDKDFFNVIKKLLSTSLDYNSINLFPLQETVEKYSSIYGVN